MMEAKLYVQKLDPSAKEPVKKNETDSGFDLYAHSFKKVYQNFGGNGEREVTGKQLNAAMDDKTIELAHFERVLVGTGLKVTCGVGYEIQVRPRSGTALKQGITVLNTPGTIDEGYRDELGVILVNLSRKVQTVTLDSRIAQLVVCPVALPEIEVVPELPAAGSKRQGGFGSTGNA